MLARDEIIFREITDAIYKVLADENRLEALLRYEERKAEEEWMRDMIQKAQAETQKTKAETREAQAKARKAQAEIREKEKRIAELEKALAEREKQNP